MRGFHRRELGPCQCASLQPRHVPIPAAREEEHRAVSPDREPGINTGISAACPQIFGCNIQTPSALLSFKLNLQRFTSTEVFLPFSAKQGRMGNIHVMAKVTAELTQLPSPCSLASCKCSLCMSARCRLSRRSLMAQVARACAYHPPASPNACKPSPASSPAPIAC